MKTDCVYCGKSREGLATICDACKKEINRNPHYLRDLLNPIFRVRNKMIDELKGKMIYCHNQNCNYCDALTGWCILTVDIEFDTTCPIKDEIEKNYKKYIVEPCSRE